MEPVVNVNRRECLKEEAIMPASEMLAKIKHLVNGPDPYRVARDGPTMQSREELAEFCDVYDHVVQGYQLLTQDYQQLSEDNNCHCSSWPWTG